MLVTSKCAFCQYCCLEEIVRIANSFTASNVSKDGYISGPYFLVFGPEITPCLGTFHLKFRFSSGLEDIFLSNFLKAYYNLLLVIFEWNLFRVCLNWTGIICNLSILRLSGCSDKKAIYGVNINDDFWWGWWKTELWI